MPERAKRRVVLGLAALLLVLPAACGRQEPELTFAVGGAPAELAFWEELAAEFEAETGIAVRILRQPSDTDQIRQGLVIALKAGQPDPDLFLMDVAWVGQMAAAGWLEPLDGKLAAGELSADQFFPNVVALADVYDGQTLALPVYMDAGVLYYRQDLLAQHGMEGPPETWEELVTISRRVMESRRAAGQDGFWGFAWQGAQYEGLACTFLEFAAGAGGGFESRADGGLRLAGDANRRALTFMRDLIHRWRLSPPSTYTEMREEEVRQLFQRGDALFERNWPYAWPLHQAPGSPVAGKVGIAPLPRFAHGRRVAALGGWHLGMSRRSDRSRDARRFMAWVLSYETQKRLALRLGWNPGRRDVYDDEEVLDRLPHLAQLRQVFARAVPRPTVPYYMLLSRAVQRHVNAVLADEEEPAAALDSMQRSIDRLARRYGAP